MGKSRSYVVNRNGFQELAVTKCSGGIISHGLDLKLVGDAHGFHGEQLYTGVVERDDSVVTGRMSCLPRGFVAEFCRVVIVPVVLDF